LTIREASEALEKGASAIPIVENGQLLGIVTKTSLAKGLMMEKVEDS